MRSANPPVKHPTSATRIPSRRAGHHPQLVKSAGNSKMVFSKQARHPKRAEVDRVGPAVLSVGCELVDIRFELSEIFVGGGRRKGKRPGNRRQCRIGHEPTMVQYLWQQCRKWGLLRSAAPLPVVENCAALWWIVAPFPLGVC